jgi:peptide chain release factor
MSEIILHVTSGQGPEECEWVVSQLVQVFGREAAGEGLECAPLEPLDGPVPSVLLRVSGDSAEGFAASRTGTVRWIGDSTFRPGHNRRNWFVGVSVIPEGGNVPDLHEKDIVYQTLRASGPGGQHVNKTESAVRATHVPTGLVAVSQEQRSQQANRKVARLKLSLLLEQQRARAQARGRQELWSHHQSLERGNAVRSYEGVGFRVRRRG